MKQIIVIKNSKTKLHVKQNYMIVDDNVIAYRYIKSLYINKLLNISISECLKLSSIFKVFFIDRYGNLLGEVKLYEEI
ncbi:hypothetical protein MLC52_09915 [Sulfurimonas sp. NW15]|uniref:hypothetical protein n=1 Tax=Sulfurimonas TaxID=202746 RepID=UPI00125FEDDE|nr:hypothetical protein [Sulfurimonas hydrogeniphila]